MPGLGLLWTPFPSNIQDDWNDDSGNTDYRA